VDTNEAKDYSLTIFINYRLVDLRGNLLGVTGVGIEMKNFSHFLHNTQEKYNRRVFLVDENGIIQAHSQMAMIETTSIFDLPGLEEIAGEILIASDNPIDHEYRIQGHRTLVTSRYMPEIDWYLIVEQDEESALSAARMNLLRTLLIGFATSVVIIIVSYVALRYLQGTLEYMTVTDDLTQTANRREFESQFERAVYRHKRYNSPISVILIDVDRFKEINDTKGHLAGDDVLKRVSRCLKDNMRPTDLLARWGGDEFIILAESDGNQAITTAERLCRAVQEIDLGLKLESLGNITISCGVTEFLSEDTIDSVTHRADQALYRSKKSGRNRVSLET
jgi:diguanylate cyclase (GGDEF)-like protein